MKGRAGFRKISKPTTTTAPTSTTSAPTSAVTNNAHEEGNEVNQISNQGESNNHATNSKGQKRTRQSISTIPTRNNQTSRLPPSSSPSPSSSSSNVASSKEDNNNNNAKKRKTSIDSQIQINSTLPEKQKEKTKTYYPQISFDPHDVIKIVKENYSPIVSRRKSDPKTRRSSRGQPSSSSSSSTPTTATSSGSVQHSPEINEFSHENITTVLVNQICQQELQGLKSHFSDERYQTKQDSLTIHLYKILEDLTSSVADNLPSDVVFTPELSSRELLQIEQLNDTLSKLQSQYETIKQYSQDTQQLLDEWGVLTGEDVSKIANKSYSNKSLSETQRYEHQLNQLTQTINGLLDGLDGVARDVNIAKDTQEKLYSAHHKERFSQQGVLNSPSENSKGRHKIPSDTRALIKGFPK